MRKIVCFLLTLVVVLSLCACGTGGENTATDPVDTTAPADTTTPTGTEPTGDADPNALHVGFARESIIPDILGVQIAGGDASARLSEGYLDELAVTCVAIREGGETVLLYTIDFITVDKHVYAAQEKIVEATGVPAHNILLNTTHTHSGVSIRSSWPGVDNYRTMYQDAAARAGVDAIKDLSPAEMYYGSDITENMVVVRHYLMNNGTTYGNGHGSSSSGYKEHLYPADGEMQVIKFARPAADKKDVVLMNLGAHATIVNGVHAKLLSADWPGVARAYVEHELDDTGMPDPEKESDYLCAVFEAAAGDQIPNSAIKSIAPYGNKHPEFGNKLGEYCMGVLNGEMTKATGTGIRLHVMTYTAPTMKEGLEDAERFNQAKEISSLSSKLGSSHAEVKALVSKYGFPSVYEATGLVSRSKYPATYSMELHYMSIDGVAFIFAPFEMFGVTGREIKDNSPYDMTFVITCSENADGYHRGYLPHALGCEESFYEYDVTKFQRGTAEDLAKMYVKLLTEMKNES